MADTIIDGWISVHAPPPPQLKPVRSRRTPTKFFSTGLEKLLKAKGIRTNIATGTAAQRAVLYTATGASIRGFNVIVPIDGMSSENAMPNNTRRGIWPLRQRTTLTRFDMIKFRITGRSLEARFDAKP